MSSTTFGAVIGAGASGYFADKYGRKKVLISTSFIFAITAILMAISPDSSFLIATRFLCGIAVGLAAMAAPLYIGEIAPNESRGKLVTSYQAAICVGIVCAYLVSLGLIEWHLALANSQQTGMLKLIATDDVWRFMLGSEIVPSIILFVMVCFIPESPRWLVKKGKLELATEIFSKIEPEENAKALIDEIHSSINQGSSTRFRDLFGHKLKKRTYMAVFVAAISQLTGINAVLFYGPEILKSAGLSFSNSMSSQVLLGLILAGATIGAMYKIDKVGRKPLLFYGSTVIVLSLIALGLLYILHINIGILRYHLVQ